MNQRVLTHNKGRMMKIRFRMQQFLLIIFIMSCGASLTATTPMNMFHDPAPMHSVTGNNFFNVRPSLHSRSLDLLPFYYSSHYAKNECRQRVPEGDYLGRWNLIGVLHGSGGAPGGSFTSGSTPVLNTLYTYFSDPSHTGTTDVNGMPFISDTYTDSTQTFAYFSVPSKIEAKGVRLNARLPLFLGFTLSAKTGLIHYTRSPKYLDLTYSTSEDGTIINPSGNDITIANQFFTNWTQFEGIAKDINLSLDPYSHTGWEDTMLELDWSAPFALEKKNKHIVTLTPAITVGATFPTGSVKDERSLFSVSTGNNGHFGLLLRADCCIEFSAGTGFDVGGDILFLNKKNEKNVRIPTSWSQSGIYPWQIDIERQPGITWSLHAGMIGKYFMDSVSCFINYVYTSHEKDKIEVDKADSRYAAFVPEKSEKESSWEAQMVNFGFDYEVTPELAIGFGAQVPLTGARILRTTTLMGTLRLVF